MIKEIKKEERTEKWIQDLLEVWEDSVRASHRILYEE